MRAAFQEIHVVYSPLSLKAGKPLIAPQLLFLHFFCQFSFRRQIECTEKGSVSVNLEVLSLCFQFRWAFNHTSLLMTNPLFLFSRFFFSFMSSPLFVALCFLGNIKNTEPLDSKQQHVHTFWVTAFDCGKNRAQADAQVAITVKPSCKPGWMGNRCSR